MQHLIKLCVGVDHADQLAEWQKSRTKLMHVTRMFPKRKDDILSGGSLYWVIKGEIRVRQRILDLKEIIGDDGIRRCGIVFDRPLMMTRPAARRPFQGWRYLSPEDAPPDIGLHGTDLQDDIPDEMRDELSRLGVL